MVCAGALLMFRWLVCLGISPQTGVRVASCRVPRPHVMMPLVAFLFFPSFYGLADNDISDLSALSALPALADLAVAGNQLVSLGGLAVPTLTTLDASGTFKKGGGRGCGRWVPARCIDECRGTR